MPTKAIDQATFDLSVKNPSGGEEVVHRTPADIMEEIASPDAESGEGAGEDQGAAMKKGWATKKLAEVTTKIEVVLVARGGDESYKPEGISLIRSLNVYDDGFREAKLAYIDDVQANDLSNVVVEKHDVLLNITGASVARCCRAPAEFLPARVNQHVSIIRPIVTKLDSDFLQYLLTSPIYKSHLLHTGEEGGSTRQAITKGQLQDFVVEFPDSVQEQRRIVGILDEAFAGIATAKANAEKNLQNAHALFESHLNSIFTQPGSGWTETTLGNVCQFVGGSQPPKSVFSKTEKANYVRLIQIRDYKSDKHIVFIPRDLAKRFCCGNDVMIGRYGPPLFQILRGIEGAYNVALMKAVPDETKLSRDFLFYFLKHSAILQYVIYHSERAAGQIGVTKQTLEPYPIALPSLAEQKNIVTTIVELDSQTQHLAHI
ncbi:MAG: restriction endonuclease subunit S [Pirellulales bacterium]